MSDDAIRKNISKNIGKYRELAGLSQKELAKKLGVVPSRISNWETGANCPTIDILFKVCEILNVSINDIYGIYPDSKFVLEYKEQELIKKYRVLDKHGKKMVDFTLQEEWERATTERKTTPDFPVNLCPHLHLLQNYGKSLVASITDVLTLKDVDSLRVYDDIKHLIRKIIIDKSFKKFSESEATYFITEFVLAIAYRDIILDNNWFADIYNQCCFITNQIPTNERTKLFNLNMSLNAAHEHTDVEVTDEMKKHDDAFFDEED